MPDLLILGVGNDWRRDDGAGRAVARRLRERWGREARILELQGEASELLAAWEGEDRVIVIDAVASGARPGTVHRLDASAGPAPAALCCRSTHGFGVVQAVELGRGLGRLPRSLTIYGIEGGDFDVGEGLSLAVARAVEEVVAEIEGAIRA